MNGFYYPNNFTERENFSCLFPNATNNELNTTLEFTHEKHENEKESI